ncbi:TetR/AcrR family transcriptional regulator [Microbispora sp. ATCC PTA-5024]|uniref:TetR/AcrR family transcriptional regulator n=1 Tax=Microbispora sp. ATCC PTA-5024 TaxID=316330 RepID=UPI0022B6E0B1|nr:TetR/AcrR family transcriptional regulator [Microbispora sp. ATCC PTA-5024]
MTVTTERDPEDLTARARIRDAALYHFGEHGFERATIRGIAETAGVSPGLVRHHFGSKQGLREACDEYLVALIHRFNDRVRADTSHTDMSYIQQSRAALRPYQRYMARALSEGAAASLFDEVVNLTEEWLADMKRPDPPAVPLRVRATIATAMAMAVPILYEHVSRGLGVDMFSPEGDLLLSRALLDLYSHPLISPEEAAVLLDALDRTAHRATPAGREAVPGPDQELHDE